MSNEDKLSEIFSDDPLGLLDVKPKQSSNKTDVDRLIESFQEINDFIQEHGKEPGRGDIAETKLFLRLKGIRENNDKIQILNQYDIHDLLDLEESPVESVDDIFGNDELGLLDSDEDDIFKLNHIPKETNMPDYVARRKPCQDFEEFEPMFIQCQKDLASGKRRIKPFAKEQHIEEGHFFVLKGVLLYVDNVGEKTEKKGKVNARLRCIFENGTESDMLLRSLSAELYKDGRRITEHKDKYLDNFNGVTEEDKEVGFIYILKSESREPKIKEIDNLYKVGFSSRPVEERIQNAKNDPTFLMAPVSIVSEFTCYNMNPQKFELLIHRFFSEVCLNIDVHDHEGNRHTPREWFIAPYSVIEDAITYIINGEIVDYKYDPEKEQIVGR
jgi:hypothetical protein